MGGFVALFADYGGNAVIDNMGGFTEHLALAKQFSILKSMPTQIDQH